MNEAEREIAKLTKAFLKLSEWHRRIVLTVVSELLDVENISHFKISPRQAKISLSWA